MLNLLAFRRTATSVDFTKSGYYEVDMTNTETLEIPLKIPNTTLIIHDSSPNYRADLYNHMQTYLGTYNYNTQSIVYLINQTGHVYVTKTGDLPTLHLTILVPDSTTNFNDCHLFIISSITDTSYTISGDPAQKVSYNIQNNDSKCFIFTSPNVNSYSISGNSENYKEIISSNNLKALFIATRSITETITITPNQKTDLISSINFLTDYLPANSIFIPNSQHIIEIKSGVYDINYNMSSYNRLLIHCPSYTVIHFHTFPGTITALTKSKQYGALLTEKPGFAFGPETGVIMVNNALNEIISFSAAVHSTECESILLFSDYSSEQISIKNTTYNICIFISAITQLSVKDYSSSHFGVYLPYSQYMETNDLKVNGSRSMLLFYDTGIAKDCEISVTPLTPDSNNFKCRFTDTTYPMFLTNGDLRSSYVPLVINAKGFVHRTLELIRNQGFIININTKSSVMVHENKYTTKTAVINQQNIDFTELFDFGDNIGKVICNQTSPTDVFNVVVTVFPNNHKKIHFTTEAVNYNFSSPFFSPSGDFYLIESDEILFVYSSSDVRTVSVSFLLDPTLDLINFYTLDYSRGDKGSDTITLVTNFLAFSVSTSYMTSASYIKINFADLPADPLQYSRSYKEDTNYREIKETNQYTTDLIPITLIASKDMTLYSKGIDVQIRLKGSRFFVVVHNNNYTATSLSGKMSEFIGTFSPSNKTYGTYLPEGGFVNLQCPCPIVYASVLMNLNICDRLAISNIYEDQFYSSRAAADKHDDRNITLKPGQSVCYYYCSPYLTNLEITSELAQTDYFYVYNPARGLMTIITKTNPNQKIEKVYSALFLGSISSRNSKEIVVKHEAVNSDPENVLLNFSTTISAMIVPSILNNYKTKPDDDAKSLTLMSSTLLLIVFVIIVAIMLVYCAVIHYIKARIDRTLHSDNSQDMEDVGSLVPTRPVPSTADNINNNREDENSSSNELENLDNTDTNDGTNHPYMIDQSLPSTNPYMNHLLSDHN
ncbi:hypothetical protein TVAG_336630 [Trichomonas vaginalis G3]|uniref:Uncharacterized protein n=1 Tax=Trichomonas vaginalis (strain ATCC PRA-98 / G3) TaxID=412133 RepID=A2FLW7_TRIV3|nr:hypothetical protein TVAG_336630 [Trichomonas vaginalis G3]|eukprot:XP_001307030.1 hypothetical protein [Trichomonas vaginalis G3]